MAKVFREKNLEKLSAPEDLNDYIRVTTPSVWLVMLALVLILVGFIAWSILGTVEVTNVRGQILRIHPITFVTN